MIQEYKVTVKNENALFATLSIKYCKRIHIFFNMKKILSEVFEEYDFDKTNIQSLSVSQKGKNVCIEIKYCKADLQMLTRSADKKEQIIITLIHLGYPLEKIRKIEYKKKDSKCDKDNQMIWKIELDEHYDSDESFSQRDDEMSLSKALSEFLETDISVSMY